MSSRLHSADPKRRKLVDTILRVDHAGETGAVAIYEAQKAILGKGDEPLLEHMKAQEEEHLQGIKSYMHHRRTRPTALLPMWRLAGLALGAGTALMGREAAMACTVAVETAIGEHYNDQIRSLVEAGYDEDELVALIKKNRDEELEHLDTGLQEGAERAPAYSTLSNVIKAGCKVAIEVAKRV